MKLTVKFAPTLLSLALLTDCGRTPTDAVIANNRLCKDWAHQKVSKNDKLTDETATGIEASNKSRPAWGCLYGKDEAAKG